MTPRDVVPNTTALPPGYLFHTKVDLKDDKKAAVAIQVVFVLIVGAMVGLGLLLDLPLRSGWSTGVTVAVTVVSCLAYMVVHELTHGAFLRMFSGVSPTFALRFPYLITGSPGYFNRRSFVVIALAPAVVWGVVLVLLLVTVPSEGFFAVYVVAVLNFASSAGDYFQAHVFAKLPRSALINDDGTATRVFLPAT